LRTRKHLIKIIWKAYIFKYFKKNRADKLPFGSIVYISDTNTWAGGLVDRLKGIISLYDFAKEKKLPFYIFSDQKNDFSGFLQIKLKNVRLDALDRKIRGNKVHYFIDNTIVRSYSYFFSSNKIHHVYTNLDLLKYKYGSESDEKWRLLFHQLFNPSGLIKTEVDKIIGGRDFIVCSFRFRSRMGDFKDDGREWDKQTKIAEIEKLNKAVENTISKFPNKIVYVASDSATYIKQLLQLDPNRFFYNSNLKADINDMERSIIEFLVISQGERVFQFKRPSMFSGVFSYYASIIGNIRYELVEA